VRLREQGAPLGEVFSFLSGLYFRGKLTYASKVRARARDHSGSRTRAARDDVVADDLRAIAAIGVAPDEPKFRRPLQRDALALASSLGPGDIVVLLGSIATGKYVDVIEHSLGGRLLFPPNSSDGGT
jgi:hypothetical protein